MARRGKLLGYLINREAADIFFAYLRLTTRREFCFDTLWSVLLATLALTPVLITKAPSCEVLEFTSGNMATVITALSILAGFNATSVAVITSSSSKTTEDLRTRFVADRTYTYLEVIIAHFCWAIIVQLILLLCSSMVLFWLKFFYAGALSQPWRYVFWFILIAGTISVIYSIVLTVRNISILYYYMVAQTREGMPQPPQAPDPKE